MSGSSSQQESASENNSSSIGIGGDNNGYVIDGNGNSFTQTDYGAISVAGSIAQASIENNHSISQSMAALSSEGMSLANELGFQSINVGASVAESSMALVDSLASGAFGFADSVVGTNAAVVNQYGDLSALMLDRTLATGEGIFSEGAQLLSDQSDRNLSAALSVTEAGAYQQMKGYDFARDLFAQNGDAAIIQQQTNSDALGNGFKSMMQFAEGFSRSDGNAVAEINMKTIGLLALAAIGVAFAMRKG